MKRLALLLLPILPLLAACSSLPKPYMPSLPDVSSWVTPYRIDVRQGNYVSQEMVSQLKPGMSKDQVRFALGTPLLKDMFHDDRWDYVYLFQPGKGAPEERKIAVFFDAQGKLLRLGGDVIPAGTQPVVAAPAQRVVEITAPEAAVPAAKPVTEVPSVKPAAELPPLKN
jgi:outer membrane protein assembly factor BamE